MSVAFLKAGSTPVSEGWVLLWTFVTKVQI